MGLSIAGLENRLMNFNFMKKLTSPRASTAAATIALVSNLTKDAFNCYYYVTQSLSNDRIPEDKRKFVAGLDLSNGILNVVTQTLIGKNVMTWSDKIFDKFIAPKFYGEKAVKAMGNLIENNSLEELKDVMKLNKSVAKIGLSVISTLVATQVICKRIIVPLLATPLATVFKKQFEKHDPKCQKQQQQNQDTATTDKKPITAKSQDNDVVFSQNQKEEKLPDCFKSFVK